MQHVADGRVPVARPFLSPASTRIFPRMQDLTTGPITRHLLKTTSFMLVTMVFQTLYFLIDLYWVGRLGTEAVAAVGIAGNLTFIVLALTQMLGVGTTAVVSHAVGRKDHGQALLLFNQSQVLAMVTGVVFLVVGMAARWPYARAMSADAKTAELAAQYLLWFIPAMALQFALVAMGAALRAVGNFKPGMIVSTATVIINMILAPFLIFGWGTGHRLGVAGAAISSLVAIVIGIVWLAAYFLPRDAYLRFEVADWKPRFDLWKKMLAIGLPAGFEFAMTAVYLALVYSITRPFGAAAQAGFGIGMRIIQAGFMPVVALGFSVAPVAGQNFGARQAQRVKRTFADAAWMAAGVMLLFAIACHTAPAAMIRVFSKDPAVIAVGTEYLRIISWNYVASGLIFVASSMFQAMGNTVPSLVSSGVRIGLVTIFAVMLARTPGFQLHWIWYLSVASVLVQLALSMALLRREFGRRLSWDAGAGAAAA
jgi:MATE family, multidrug efflux pump